MVPGVAERPYAAATRSSTQPEHQINSYRDIRPLRPTYPSNASNSESRRTRPLCQPLLAPRYRAGIRTKERSLKNGSLRFGQ